jgi:hypothetical protein
MREDRVGHLIHEWREEERGASRVCSGPRLERQLDIAAELEQTRAKVRSNFRDLSEADGKRGPTTASAFRNFR